MTIYEKERVFAEFCATNDKDGALGFAVTLADEYKSAGEFENILKLNKRLVTTFDEPRSSTEGVVITKAAIEAALCIIEDVKETQISDELATLVCESVVLLPMHFHDVDFMLSCIKRITACYDSEFEPKLVLAACFLPALKVEFNMLRERFMSNLNVGGIDVDGMQGIIDACDEYFNILFENGYPELETGVEFRLKMDTEKVDEYLAMYNETQNVYDKIFNLEEDNQNELPTLKARYDNALAYFENLEIGEGNFSEMNTICNIAFLISAWRELDLGYTLSAVEPYVQRMIQFEPDEKTSVGLIYSLQTNLTYINEAYAYADDDAAEYKCLIKYLKLVNVYLKKILFERGIDYFLVNTQKEYIFYHYVLQALARIVTNNGYSANELYFELCKRKNIFYLGEMWQKQAASAAQIRELLRKDFTFDELKNSVPSDGVLVDFFYVRQHYNGEEFDESAMESRENSTCAAFLTTAEADKDVKICLVANGRQLAQLMYDENEYVPFFKRFAGRLLEGYEDKSRLIVCADGDVNRLSFASLPYKDGYITDYFAVRNIASVLDVVYPRPSKKIGDALIVYAPDYGQINGVYEPFEELITDELEDEKIRAYISEERRISADCLTGSEATADNIKSKMSNHSYGLVHISTHGFFEEGKAYLAAAGANVHGKGATISDEDLSGVSLNNTALAVYALCLGARQKLELQDSLSGFIKASLLAGANAIIAPIDEIPDLSGTVFMSEFYRLYLDAYEAEDIETVMRKTINKVRNMKRQELSEKYGIEDEESREFPLTDVSHWGNWVCFSSEIIR